MSQSKTARAVVLRIAAGSGLSAVKLLQAATPEKMSASSKRSEKMAGQVWRSAVHSKEHITKS